MCEGVGRSARRGVGLPPSTWVASQSDLRHGIVVDVLYDAAVRKNLPRAYEILRQASGNDQLRPAQTTMRGCPKSVSAPELKQRPELRRATPGIFSAPRRRAT